MLISPPFLPARNADDLDAAFVDAAMPDAAVNCAGTSVPEGSFPVSLKLGWHGGVHLHAPSGAGGVLPVLAIADGEIVYARRPTAQVDTPTHPLNYNPYGDQAAWTDDGMVVIRHTTDIGDGANAQDVVFYSVYMHLSQLRGAANTVAASATATTRRIYRKDEIGSAGRIYAAPDHIHFEIVCDDANLNKLINRQTGDLALTADGRTDAVYGEIYFHLPVGTTFYENNPGATVVTPTAAPLYTSNSDLFIGLRYAGGEGVAASRGDAYLSTYLADGTQLGDAAGVIEENEAEYNLYTTANAFSTAQPVARRPAPSAAYEFLRFGRVIDTAHETAISATIPHWKQVRYEGGLAWVNLNNQAGNSRVHVFSDADFPQWRGWKLINDDTDDDSRCESALLTGLIEDVSAADGQLSPVELIQRLGEASVRKALEKTICKFPSELNRDTIDARWGWLQTDPDYQLAGESWTNFRAHVEALTVPAASLPEPLRTAHWHFHPRAFIRQFRKCSWLSLNETIQLIPVNVIRKPGSNNSRSLGIWEQANVSRRFLNLHRVELNKALRRFLITSPLRQACFIGNSTQETTWFSDLRESGGNQPTLHLGWFGRGFLQLTNPHGNINRGNNNYYKYFKFIGRDPVVPPGAQEITWRDQIGTDSYHAANSAAAYWVWPDKTTFEPRVMLERNLTENSVGNTNKYADVLNINERRTIQTTQHGVKVWYHNQSFTNCCLAVNYPGAFGSNPPNMNGLVDRSTSFSNALMVLTDTPLFRDVQNHDQTSPEEFVRRTL